MALELDALTAKRVSTPRSQARHNVSIALLDATEAKKVQKVYMNAISARKANTIPIRGQIL